MEFDYEFILTSTDKIKIGNDITITAIRLNHNETHIGCDAPKHIEILRQELIEKINLVKLKP
ncbi:MAG: carbon storage regulator [Thiohalomonadales bacterium]